MTVFVQWCPDIEIRQSFRLPQAQVGNNAFSAPPKAAPFGYRNAI